MAVTATVTRQHSTSDQTTFTEFCSATLSGTYVQGGFTFNPFVVYGGKGSSPLPSTQFLAADWYSPTGYRYISTISGTTLTTKIYGVGGTELSAGAIPDTTIPVVLRKRKI